MIPTRTIWLHPDQVGTVQLIDQRYLPHELVIEDLRTCQDAATAIREMHVRGAPLIGATAAWGMYLACRADARMEALHAAAAALRQTRPTAVDLFHAIDKLLALLAALPTAARVQAAHRAARAYADDSVQQCAAIGQHGLPLIAELYERKQTPVQLLTHCNAGWLACIEHGTATAPIYRAHAAGIPVHVWVDETRPRLQGSRLTAYELELAGVPHTVITDNAGGHLMQHGKVDLVLVGSDRTTRDGDVANKIGTYLKALAAHDNRVPFYAAVPSTSIDWSLREGVKNIPIEERDYTEVAYVNGQDDSGDHNRVRIMPAASQAANFGFDVTPARLVTGIVTERGVCAASEAGLTALFPEYSA